jgi:hypothetical protein
MTSSILGSDAATVEWYYGAGSTFDFPPLTNVVEAGGITVLDAILGSSTSVCENLSMLELIEDLDSGGESIGMSSHWEAELNEQLTKADHSHVPPTLYAYIAMQYRYKNSNEKMNKVLSQTNISEFEEIAQKCMQGKIDSALVLVQAIQPINTSEELLRQVWDIRINAALAERDWSESEQLLLWSIAQRDLREVGPAAILAQSLLGITLVPDEWVVDEVEARILNPQFINGRLYPNPAQASVFFPVSDCDFSAEFIDLQGRLVQVVRVMAGTQSSVNISTMPNGYYTVQIKKSNGYFESHKLFISR